MLRTPFLVLATILGANGQTLYEAISAIPELSNFTAFYETNEVFANEYFGNESSYPITFLAPNNDAFANYEAQTGTPLIDISLDTLLELVQYHTLVSSLSKDNFTNNNAGGLTTPTFLTDPEYNNRSVGISMASKFGGATRSSGQVVFIKSANSGASSKRFVLMNRQEGMPQSSASIRSGLSSNVNLTALDDSEGTWSGGRFHIVDGLLTPPTLCATTIRHAGLTGLDNALNRSGLWDALDGAANVTCLGPSNQAFQDADSPDSKLNATALTDALLYHTLPQVAYSDYLIDGQEFTSLQKGTVRVKIQGSGSNRTIYFNNAKVIDANVLTHNGLMHVLDAVLVPLEQSNATSTPSATLSYTATPTATQSSAATATTNAAAPSAPDGHSWSLFALLGAAAWLL